MLISLSILEYEQDLSENTDNLLKSQSFLQILKLVETKKLYCVHVDVMRPPLIPNRTAFSIKLIGELYHALRNKIPLAIHLMVPDPLSIIDETSRLIPRKDRAENIVIIQRESFDTEDETLEAMDYIREQNYRKVGVCLDLPTPCEALSEKIVEAADMILLMTVRMGRGGQKYADEGTEKILYFSSRFPHKFIEVDGGINPQTAPIAERAGAKAAVVGSFITRSDDPIEALLELTRSFSKEDAASNQQK